MHSSSRYRKLFHAVSALWCAGTVAAAFGQASPAVGQVTSVLRGGPPVQVLPYASEPRVPLTTIAPRLQNPFAGADGMGGDRARRDRPLRRSERGHRRAGPAQQVIRVD